MVDINLLPWRELRRKRKIRLRRYCMNVIGILVATVLCVMHYFLNDQINKMNDAILFWQHKDAEVIQQAQQIKKIAAFQKDYQNAFYLKKSFEWNFNILSALLNKMIHAISYQITFYSMQYQVNKIFLWGCAQSSESLSRFVEELSKARHIEKINIVEIIKDSKQQQFKFKLEICQDPYEKQ